MMALIALPAFGYTTSGYRVLGCTATPLVTDQGHQIQFCKAEFWRPSYGYSFGLIVNYLGPYRSSSANGITVVINNQSKTMIGAMGGIQKQASFVEVDHQKPFGFSIVFDGQWDSRNGENYTIQF